MGEIAESMLNGDSCEMCGVPLEGEGFGAPRYCSASCAKDRGAGLESVATDDDSDDESEFWRHAREVGKQQHAEWRDRVSKVVGHKVAQLVEKGHTVTWITEWQVRIDKRYDIFWQSKRYHDIKLNKRGDYFDLISFIESKSHEQRV